MPKRYKVEATVTLYDNQQLLDQDTSSEEFDDEEAAQDAFKRKKNA